MDYSVTRLPPADWLIRRHQDLPAMFRDSFGHTRWWSSEQQQAIRAFCKDWSSDPDHPIRRLKGYMTHSSLKRTSTGDFLNHTVGYWIDRLHKRSPGSTAAGSIIYGAFLPVLSPVATALRPGPVGLGFHHHDLLHCIGSNTLNFIAGMQHCTTSTHVDEGAEAVWYLLLEGQKVWMMARREDVEAMRTQLPADKTMAWWRLEASQREWVHNQRCIMIVQNAGDIIYLLAQWPHTVRHLTDTLALQGTMGALPN